MSAIAIDKLLSLCIYHACTLHVLTSHYLMTSKQVINGWTDTFEVLLYLFKRIE